jgi:selenocysteine lyase/cysteine desulfurase
LGLLPNQGVVRVSLVHYNTIEECDRLIEQLAKLL